VHNGKAILTAVPSLGVYLLTLRLHDISQARTAAFFSVVATQLAQTLDLSATEGRIARPVLGAIGGSAGILVAMLAIPGLRNLANLVPMPPTILSYTIGAAVLAYLGSHTLSKRY
jgi:cation-transporting ATPase I